jgi:hypothetical protein
MDWPETPWSASACLDNHTQQSGIGRPRRGDGLMDDRMRTIDLLVAMQHLVLEGSFSYEARDGEVVRAWFGRGSGPDGDAVDVLALSKALYDVSGVGRYRLTIERV